MYNYYNVSKLLIGHKKMMETTKKERIVGTNLGPRCHTITLLNDVRKELVPTCPAATTEFQFWN